MTVHVTPTIKTTDYPDFYAEVVRYAAYDLHSEAVPAFANMVSACFSDKTNEEFLSDVDAFVDEEMDGLQ